MTNIGVDVAQEWVDLGVDGKVRRVERTEACLLDAFSKYPAGSRVLMEPTGRYHRIVVDCARKAGHEVRLVDPFAFSLYQRSLSPRASNDKISALLLARFAEKEWDRVPEYKPIAKHLQKLKDLLEARQTQNELRVALMQSMAEVKDLPASTRLAVKSIERSIKDIELQIFAIVKTDPLFAELRAIDGVGPLNAAALVWLFRAFSFTNSDQVVAFVGLDVRVRESGKYVGQRKMTKRGPRLIRWLLCCAAHSLRRTEHFKPLFAKYHARGFRTKGVNVILGRRIVRAAFEVACHGARYDRARFYTP